MTDKTKQKVKKTKNFTSHSACKQKQLTPPKKVAKMFDSFKDKMFSVQEGITTRGNLYGAILGSLQRMSVGDSSKKHEVDHSVNLDAGSELLHHFHTEWEEVHKLAEENAAKAQELDIVIGKLHSTFEKQWKDVGNVNSAMATVPQLIAATQSIIGRISELQETFANTEIALRNLEDLVDTQEYQEKQLEQRYQLAMYKQKRMQELCKVKDTLEAEHAQKVKDHELKQKEILRQRQETFGQAFQEDMEHYRQTQSLPGDLKHDTSPTDAKGPTLEEITLDDDTGALDSFLDDPSDSNTSPSLTTLKGVDEQNDESNC